MARVDGFTLVELLVAMVLTLIVFSTTLDVISVAFRRQSESGQRAQATQLGSAILERMTREIRQASQATVENATGAAATPGGRLDVLVPSSGGTSTTQHVVYDCTSANQCTRAYGPVGGSLSSPTPIIGQVVNGNTVFNGSPGASNPTFIWLTLDESLGAPLSNPVELQSGVALRDLTP
jgi:prepilin-type N-terminal cleavage/methylation domain-containing protein